MKRCCFFIVDFKKEALKMLQDIIIITVVTVAAALAVKHLMKGSCNCCNKVKKGSSCRASCHLKK
jgi:hypothetical protein